MTPEIYECLIFILPSEAAHSGGATNRRSPNGGPALYDQIDNSRLQNGLYEGSKQFGNSKNLVNLTISAVFNDPVIMKEPSALPET